MLDKVFKKVNKPSILSQFTQEELEGLIEENSSLRGYLQGYLGELALKKQLLQLPGITEVVKIPDQDEEKGDFRVTYKGKTMTVEVKSLLSSSVKPDILHDSWQGRVSIKNTDKRELEVEGLGTISTTSLVKGDFDILAICCYAVNDEWEFLFIENEYLPEKSPEHPGILKTSFVVNPEITPLVVKSFFKVADSVLVKKYSEIPNV